jgi:xanthine dehydrogenase accessory factor
VLAVIRGGGDLATGVAWRLTRAGVAVVVTELADPLTVRRTVSLSTAVIEGLVDVEGLVGRRAPDATGAVAVARRGEVGVVVSPSLPAVGADVVVDARLAKRTLDTTIDDAPLVIGLGPGFAAGVDCHAVVETLRGPRLGRALWQGSAAPDTGTPGRIGAPGSEQGAERVLRAPADGAVTWRVGIGDRVDEGEVLGTVTASGGISVEVTAPFAGVVRGLIRPGRSVTAGLKIGDVDPRLDCAPHEISDKALAVGGGVTEAVLTWWHRSR